MRPALARTIWHHVEAINAVAYFSPESGEAAARLGLKGFWMGYFALRAAPLGPVGSSVVEATFFNFHPVRVRRAIPDAWRQAGAGQVLAVRSPAAAASLRRILTEPGAERLASNALPLLRDVIANAGPGGRPLFAANRDVEAPPDPLAALWQAATTLREHRGDGHVALLVWAELDGCETHALFASCTNIPPGTFWQSRGWTPDDWEAAIDRLRSRGLLAPDGTATTAGRELHERIESRTDELALRPYEAIGSDRCRQLLRFLEPATRRLAAQMPFPNPIGLPRPEEADGGDERPL
ncbi:MAG: SCO6745 family protein [Acidimicrobiales bacterium]